MIHPLDGARLKVVRAKQHLESFNEEAGRYISTNPYNIVPKLEGNCVGIKGVITAEPPPALACIVGDFVTNLRASLDYIAWELFSKFKPATHTALPDRERDRIERRVQFPIGSQADFAKTDGIAAHLRGTSCGIPTTAMSVIESVQPYHAGHESLDALDQLVRIDKHRTLWLCGGFLESAGSFSIYHGDKLTWNVFGFTRMEMNLAAFGRPMGTVTDYRVEMNEKPTIFVSIKDFPSPSESTWVGRLQQILECVANIVPRFDGFFP